MLNHIFRKNWQLIILKPDHLVGKCIWIAKWIFILINMLTKKCTTWKLRVKFYLGQYKDCNPGDKISDSSEKLVQRGSREGQHICDFGKGEVHAIKYIFFVESFCWAYEASDSHEGKKKITMKDFSAFLDMRLYLELGL